MHNINTNFVVTLEQYNEVVSKIYIKFESKQSYGLAEDWLKHAYKDIEVIKMATKEENLSMLLVVKRFLAEPTRVFLIDYISALNNSMAKALEAFESTMNEFQERKINEFVEKYKF